MSDLSKLADYLVEHPEAHEYRWRLAKKLYMAWEYNEALKHLLILKKEWLRKLNVLRYLAATYYRLGRYDEAVAELENVLRQWPTEVPVWEQLARVNEVAGKTEAAIKAWEGVLRLDPAHAIAERAIQRLRAAPENTPRGELRLTDSDSGINLNVGRVCKNCGAQNSEEFDRCWQCHASLVDYHTPVPLQSGVPQVSSKAWLRTLVGGLLTVAAVSASAYMALRHAPLASTEGGAAVPPETVYALLAEAWYMPRIGLLVALLIVAPVTLWSSFRLMRVKGFAVLDALGTGLLLASVTYLASWLSVPWLPLTLAVPAVVFLLAVVGFWTSNAWPRVAAVLPLTTVFLTAVILGTVVALLGADPVREWSAIVEYSRFSDASQAVGKHTLPAGTTPATYSLRWASTGSPWLDSLGKDVSITVTPDPETQPVTVEFKRGNSVEFYAEAPPYRFVQAIEPGQPYMLRISGPEGTTVYWTAEGLLDLQSEP